MYSLGEGMVVSLGGGGGYSLGEGMWGGGGVRCTHYMKECGGGGVFTTGGNGGGGGGICPLQEGMGGGGYSLQD